VLADADESNAGIASGVNNAVARVAGLLVVAALGAAISASFAAAVDDGLGGRRLSPAAQRAVDQAKKRSLAQADVTGVPAAEAVVVRKAVSDASVRAFHLGVGTSAVLVALGGLLGLVGIVNPRRTVRCEDCAGGQLAGAPAEAAQERLPVVHLPAHQEAPAAS